MRKQILLVKRENGYSFIELVMAVTVLAVVVIPLLSLLVSAYAAMVMSGSQTVAVNLCREKIEAIKANGYSHYAALMDGEDPEAEPYHEYLYEREPVPGFPQYSWEARITRYTKNLGGDFEVELMEIRVTVYWTRQDAERSVTMESELAPR